jgi:hypothetical protein
MEAKGPRSGWWIVVTDPQGGQVLGLNDQTLEKLPWDANCHRTESFQCAQFKIQLHEVSIPQHKRWHLKGVHAFHKIVGRKSAPD